MKLFTALIIAASIAAVGCGSNSPTSPDSARLTSSAIASTATPVSTEAAYFPPISPPGISCPSDAPQIRVSSLGYRMDVEFSEVAGASKYQIEIEKYNTTDAETYHMEVPAPAHRYEWYGEIGMYEVKVRTVNCGGFGNWSQAVYVSLDGGVVPAPAPTPTPEPEPTCTLEPSFTKEFVNIDIRQFGHENYLQNADVRVKVRNAGKWELHLLGSNRLDRFDYVVVDTATLECGQSATLTIHQGYNSMNYWWYRIKRDGNVVYMSQAFTH
jgi:hypothetical protein